MRESLQNLCELFIENRDIIKNTLRWDYNAMYSVCAAIFLDNRKKADEETLKEYRSILKDRTGIFSSFRGIGQIAMVCMMAASDDPEGLLSRGQDYYDLLKEAKFWGSEHLAAAAMALAKMTDGENAEEIAARTRRIYKNMKEEHPFLTGAEDSVFAALLALDPRSDEEINEDTELCYEGLRERFRAGDALQSLSHVLALCQGEAPEKCGRTIALFDRLKERGCKYGRGYELSSLGVLAMLPAELDQLADDVIQVDDFLSGQKGYGLLGISRSMRVMHAAMIVVSDVLNGGDARMENAALAGTMSLIAAEQIAVFAAIAATSASSAASSVSSGGGNG